MSPYHLELHFARHSDVGRHNGVNIRSSLKATEHIGEGAKDSSPVQYTTIPVYPQ